jgi:PAS domain S-box-containing protein
MAGASPVGVFVTDLAGSLVYANAKLAEILDVDGDLDGGRIYGLMHPEDVDRARERITEALAHGRETSVQCRFRCEDYSIIWCSIKTAPLPGSGLVGTVEDVTETHELEMQTEQARIGAERANQAKSAFLSRLSHELRTPLHAVLGFAQLLEASSLDDSQRESAQHIMSSGRHMVSIINDVLDIARAESGELNVSLAPVEIAPVVIEAANMLSLQARDKNVIVDVKLRHDDPTALLADRKRLLQIVLNILGNSIKYNKREGATIVSLEKSGDSATLVVRDTGYGIPADKVERLFTPFDRLGAENSGIEGSGLGLILSKRLTEAMHGSLRIESDVRIGTVARLTLPLAPTPSRAVVTLEDALPSIEFGRLDVLLIEDCESNISLFESVFEARPTRSLSVRKTGASGLEAAREQRPRLILLDAHLPDVVGTELLVKLKQEPSLYRTRIVVVSAETGSEAQGRFLRAGADAYLTKPFDLGSLLASIDRVMAGVER